MCIARKGNVFQINKYTKEAMGYNKMGRMGLTSSLESILSTYVSLNKLINIFE